MSFVVFSCRSSSPYLGYLILVDIITWSEMPFNVSMSYSIGYVRSPVITRSMHDRPFPFSYVYCAGGPGYMPFRMYHPWILHISITQGALGPTPSSRLFLVMFVSSIFGYSWPILAFQSPHTTDLVCIGMDSVTSSTRPRAVSSLTPRFFKFPAGGK